MSANTRLIRRPIVHILITTWLGHLGEHWSAEGRSWIQTLAGPTLRVFKYLRRNCCLLCNDICKWIDFLVFLDKDEKPYRFHPSHSTFTYLVLVGLKRTHTCLKRVGYVDPSGVANLSWAWWVSVRRDLDIG